MPQSGQWVIENHSWACISHNLTNLLSHCRSIAMSRALRTEGFVLLIWAMVAALGGVVGQCLAIVAKGFAIVMMTAINCYHIADDLLLALYFA